MIRESLGWVRCAGEKGSYLSGSSCTFYQLTLGGGHGFLTSRHGLVIDNLLSATIITGTLERLVVSPTSNPELFNALKGGGCNFGVVTSFTYRAHEQKNLIWIGVVNMPFPDKEEVEKQGQLDKLMQAAQKWYEKNGKTNTDAACMLFFGWPLGEVSIHTQPLMRKSSLDKNEPRSRTTSNS